MLLPQRLIVRIGGVDRRGNGDKHICLVIDEKNQSADCEWTFALGGSGSKHMPLRSEPEDAAVAEVFGTLAVVVAVIFTLSISTWKLSASTCATLV